MVATRNLSAAPANQMFAGLRQKISLRFRKKLVTILAENVKLVGVQIRRRKNSENYEKEKT